MSSESPTLEQLCRQVCAELTRRIRNGESQRAEDVLAAHPALGQDQDCLLEILYVEFLALEAIGKNCPREEWYRRFPAVRDEFERLLQVHDQIGLSPPEAIPGAPAGAGNRSGTWWIGRHEILEELGRGGMGVVYLARQPNLERLVALKMILAGDHANNHEMARFQAEAQTIARLQHPNIVQIYEVGEHEGCPFLALEYVAGGNLDHQLNGKPWPQRSSARLVESLARTIQFAHENGIVHRDLKPANILLQKAEGRKEKGDVFEETLLISADRSGPSTDRRRQVTDYIPKITDFGLAKNLSAATGPTRTGAVLGTPAYMAPEQAAGAGSLIGPAVDIYALGAILYELLTGRPPFQGNTALDILDQVRNQEPISVTRLQPKVSRDLETITLKCLQKEPGRRYASALLLAEDINRYLEHRPILARPTTSLERVVRWCRRNVAVASLLASLWIVFLLGFAGVAWKWREAEIASSDKELALRRETSERIRKEEALEASTSNLYFHQVALAEHEWANFNVGRVEELLAECPVDRRQWEWFYLRGLCRSGLANRSDPGKKFNEVVFQPDNTAIALSSEGFSTRIWDISSGKTLAERPWTFVWRGVLPLNRERTRLADATESAFLSWPVCLYPTQNRYILADACSGRDLFPLPLLDRNEYPVTISHDGRLLVTALAPQWKVSVRDLKTGEVVSRLSETDEWFGSKLFNRKWYQVAQFSPDDSLLALRVPGGVRLWNPRSGKVVQSLHLTENTICYCLSFHPSGRRLAGSCTNARIAVWNVETGKMEHILQGHTEEIIAVEFSPDGRSLASGGSDRSIRIWDADSGGRLRVFRGHSRSINGLDYSPDGKVLASISQDGGIRLWQANEPQEDVVLAGHTSLVSSIVYSPDGKTLVSGSYDGTARLWTNDTGKCVLTIPHGQPIHSVAFQPDGKQIALGCRDHRVRLIRADTGTLEQVLEGHRSEVISLSFHPSKPLLASADDNGLVHIWNLASGRSLRSQAGLSIGATCVAFSPDGQRLACGLGDGTLCLWDGDFQGEPQILHKGRIRVAALAFDRSGRRLAEGLENGHIALWDLDNGLKTFEVNGHASGVFGLAFSASGKRFASASHDKTVKVWDADTGRSALTLSGHDHPVMSVAFSPDDQTLASAGLDRMIRLWRAPTDRNESAVP